MSSSSSSSSSGGSEAAPRDAKVMGAILASMGIEEYEPRVIHQLLEFMYRYVAEVLSDARTYAKHANRTEVGVEDLRLAIQSKVNFSFAQPPPREVLLEFAHTRNKQKLPLIPRPAGVHLPPTEHCLTAPNYQITPKRKTKRTAPSSNSGSNNSSAPPKKAKEEASGEAMELSSTSSDTQEEKLATTTTTTTTTTAVPPPPSKPRGKANEEIPKFLFNIAGIGEEKKE